MQHVLVCFHLIFIFIIVVMASCLCYFLGRNATLLTIRILGDNLLDEMKKDLINTISTVERFVKW
jgi:hypothetical protein